MGSKKVSGSILTPNTSNRMCIVCHQVNCQGKMGAGLALEIRRKHPEVYESYKARCDAEQARLGDVQLCDVSSDYGYIIANVFGQDGYGRDRCYTDYKALYKAFTFLHTIFPYALIRVPYGMGCGLAGGNWTAVRCVILYALKDQDVEIWKLDK